MSDNDAGQGAKPVIGRPFVAGDPRINKGGPVSAKLRKLQKQLLKLSPKAFELLKKKLDEGDIEALKLWCKYVLPVPKSVEQTQDSDPYRRMTDAELFAIVRKGLDERDSIQ